MNVRKYIWMIYFAVMFSAVFAGGFPFSENVNVLNAEGDSVRLWLEIIVFIVLLMLIISIWIWKLHNVLAQRTEKLARAELMYKEFMEMCTQGVCVMEFSTPLDVMLPRKEQIDHIKATLSITECNDAYAKVYGYEKPVDVTGVPIGKLYQSSEPLESMLESWIDHQYCFQNEELNEVNHVNKPIHILSNLKSKWKGGHITSFVSAVADLNEYRDLGYCDQQYEQNDSIGGLAVGIIHDFNNIIGGIYGLTQISMKYAEDGSKLERNLEHIIVTTDRAKELIDGLVRDSKND